MSKFINNIVYYVFGVLCFGIFAACTYSTVNLVDGIVKYALLIALVICYILFLLFSNKIKSCYIAITDKLSAKKMLVILILLAVITKIGAIFVFQINSQIHPDIKEYVSYAQQFVANGQITEDWVYAYKVVRAVIYGIILSPVVEIFGTNFTAISIYISIWQIISVILFFDTLRVVINKNVAFVSMCIWILLPSEILLPQYTIHEQFLLFVISIVLWLFFRVIPLLKKRSLKCIVFIIGAVVLGVGTTVNAIGIIAAIAICIVFISKWFANSKKNIKSGAALLLAVLSIMSAVVFIPSELKTFSRSITYKDDSLKVVVGTDYWSYYVGLNEETGGSFSLEDNKAYKANDDKLSLNEVNEYRKQLLTDRVTDLITHPNKLSSLMWTKFNKIWGASKYSLDYANETISNPTMKGIYNSYLYKPLSLINCFVMCALAFMLFVSLLKNKRFKKNFFLQFLMMFMIGFTLIFLLVECNTKYVACFKVYFIITAVAGMGRFAEISDKLMLWLKKRKMNKISRSCNNANKNN